MDAGTQEMAAFVTFSGLYEWTVMPFGLVQRTQHLCQIDGTCFEGPTFKDLLDLS